MFRWFQTLNEGALVHLGIDEERKSSVFTMHYLMDFKGCNTDDFLRLIITAIYLKVNKRRNNFEMSEPQNDIIDQKQTKKYTVL